MWGRKASNTVGIVLITLATTVGLVSSIVSTVLGSLLYGFAFLFITIFATRIYLDYREFLLGDMNPSFVRQSKTLILHYEEMLQRADLVLQEMANREEINQVAIEMLQSQLKEKYRNETEGGDNGFNPDQY